MTFWVTPQWEELSLFTELNMFFISTWAQTTRMKFTYFRFAQYEGDAREVLVAIEPPLLAWLVFVRC